MTASTDYEHLAQENAELRARLAETEQVLAAIKAGQIDALVSSTDAGSRVQIIEDAELPYRVLIDEIQDGALTIDLDGTILYCNASFARMVGRPAQQVLASAIETYVPPDLIPDLKRYIADVTSQKQLSDDFWLQISPARRLPVHLSAQARVFGDIEVICIVLYDRSLEQQRKDELSLLQTLSLTISQGHTLRDAMQQVVRLICEKTEWEIGEIWLPADDRYERFASWVQPVEAARAFDEHCKTLESVPGPSLITRLWNGAHSVWFPSITDEPDFLRAAYARQVGIQSGVGIPVLADGNVVAIILFLTLQPREKDQEFIQLISSVAAHLGTYIIRKQMDEKIAYQAQLMETVQDPIIAADMENNIISWNHAAEILYSWTAAEVIGKNYRQVLQPDFLDQQADHVYAQLREQGAWTGEIVHQTRDGRAVHTFGTVSIIRDEHGNPIGGVGTHRDITAAKQAQMALEASERKYRSLFEGAPISMLEEDFSEIKRYLLDLKAQGVDDFEAYFREHPDFVGHCIGLGKVLDVNEATVRLYEAQSKSHMMNALRPVIPPETDAVNLHSLMAMAEGKTSFSFEITNLTMTGRPLRLALSWSAMPGYEESLAKVIVCSVDITDLTRAYEAVEESRRFAQATVNSLSDIIVILDENGVIVEVNQAWRRYGIANGISPDYVWEGINYLEVCERAQEIDDAQIIAMGIRRVIRREQTWFSHEYPCDTPVEQRWFNVRVMPFPGSGPMHVVVAHENITERKNAEIALREANHQLVVLNNVISLTSASLEPAHVLDTISRELSMIFHASHVIAAMLIDDESIVQIMSEYARDYPVATVRRRFNADSIPVLDILSLSRTPQVIEQNAAAQLGSLVPTIFQHVGTLLLIPLTTRTEFVGFVAVCKFEPYAFSDLEINLAATIAQAVSQSLENSLLHVDIADQNVHLERTVEERTAQLRRINSQMSTILDNTSDAIVLTQPDGMIEDVNRAFHHLFGYDRSEVLGQSIDQIGHPSVRDLIQRHFRQMDFNAPTQHFQIIAMRKDGSTVEVDCSLAYAGGSEAHIVWSLRDITHLKEIERMKDQFVSMVSHELRTPVASMVLSASSLQRYYERMKEEQRRSAIDRLNEQATLMADLIEGILDLSRIDARSIVVAQDAIEMKAVANDIITELHDSLTARQHRLISNVDLPYSFVTGSRVDIARVWRNLISNAIKYTPDGGTITINLGQIDAQSATRYTTTGTVEVEHLTLPPDFVEGRYIVGQVRDNGSGISEEDLRQLFTRFFRGQASQSNIPGTGLGLALVRELLRLYGGGITVYSKVDEGTLFTFWIPIREPEASDPTSSSDQAD